jgi:hypothetical protein
MTTNDYVTQKDQFLLTSLQFAVINLRGVSTNKTIICFIAMQTYKELINHAVFLLTKDRFCSNNFELCYIMRVGRKQHILSTTLGRYR